MPSVTAVVETPKGSAQKYDWDEGLRLFKLNKILPAGPAQCHCGDGLQPG